MKILLLAGSGEARVLAEGLAQQGHEVLASLAGATKEAAKYVCSTRVGGFGGAKPFEEFVRTHRFELVIDATHPFAQKISARTLSSCKGMGIPYLQLMRPEWQPEPADTWHRIEAPSAARHVIESGSRVFLATGRQTLPEFENLTDCYLICRQIDPPEGPFPFPNGEFLVGRPPFSVEDEIALFQELRIDVLVVKNAGGTASRSKLDAARHLKIPVVVIQRSDALDALIVPTVEGALEWVSNHADH
jgi:precorrin-6A/cobalt-precorrin-6A reductase